MAHRPPSVPSRRPGRIAGLSVALLVALGASACVPPGPGPGPGGCARDTSLPQPGDLGVRVNITGKVVLRNGQPARDIGGYAVVRDRRSNVGAVLAEAGVNEAGFFLLAAASTAVPADAGCRDYWIEVCAPSSCATGGEATVTAELDVTDIVGGAAGQGPQDVDISDEPLIYENVDHSAS